MIGIDVSGLDEIERDLEVMIEGLTVTTLNEWAAKILEEVKSTVPQEKRDLIRLQFCEKVGNDFDIKIRSPSEFVVLLKEAIEQHLAQMPLTTQQVFAEILDQISEKTPDE
jgi:hypothetical protein